MNIIKKAFIRLYQGMIYLARPFVNIKEPIMRIEEGAITKIDEILYLHFLKNAFILVDPNINKLNLIEPLKKDLEKKNIHYVIYDKISQNPLTSEIDQAYLEFLKHYKNYHEVALIAVGGGSTIDAMKGLKIKLVKKGKPLEKYRGLLKVHHKKSPLLIAAPTTCGSGAECTLASVITSLKDGHKFIINDPSLIPQYAILDPTLLKTLPKRLIASTGMDALTHLVESFIGRSNTKKTKEYAFLALKKIHDNLLKAYFDQTGNITYLSEMLLASYYAGNAFTRGYVGYVHALGHALTSLYHISHGEINAMLLPLVLEQYGKSAYKKLAILSDVLALCPSDSSLIEKAQSFISYIKNLVKELELPTSLKIKYNFIAVSQIATMAYLEATPSYPVPLLLDKDELIAIISKAIRKE